jgi:dienelactone hydrolase
MRKLLISGFLAVLLQLPLGGLLAQSLNIAGSATGRPPALSSRAFSDRSGLSKLELSPDGNLVAMKFVDADGQTKLTVMTAPDRLIRHSIALPEESELNWVNWAGNTRVLVSLSERDRVLQTDVTVRRLFVYDLATRAFSYVGIKHMGLFGDNLLYTDPAGQFVVVGIQPANYGYMRVIRFPLDGTARKSYQDALTSWMGAFQWFTDNTGTVRMGINFIEGGAYKVYYRSNEQENFKTVASFNREQFSDLEIEHLRIQAGSDLGYAVLDDGSGKTALRRFNFSTFKPGEVVQAQPGFDVLSVRYDDRAEPVSITYVADREEDVWLDPRMKALHASLSKALPGSDVQIPSIAKDGSRALVRAGSPTDPGVWYLYHIKEKRLDLLAADKPGIDPKIMADVKAVSYSARDGTTIHGYLTLPAGRDARSLPLIILPHGGPFGVRDRLTFNSEAQFLANRGYAVLQPNFRGSGGYGKAFERLGEGTIGRAMQDDLDDGMDWAVKQGIADPKRVCLVGSSYGGYAALWGVIRNPERYRCAASFAGVTDLNAILAYDADFMSRFDGRKLRQKYRGDGGGFNFDTVSPAQNIDRLNRPILLAHGEKDYIVPLDQFQKMRNAAKRTSKPVEELVFPDEGHGFSKQASETKWLDTLEAFLTRHNPAY